MNLQNHQITEKPSRKKTQRKYDHNHNANKLQKDLLFHTPNMRFRFMTHQQGDTLLQLRGTQIADIVENLQLYLKLCLNATTMNACNNKTAKFTNKIKKLTLLLGPPGTGKTSTIKHALSAFLLNEQQNTRQHMKNDQLHSIKVLTINANSLHKSQRLIQEMEKAANDEPCQAFRVKSVIINEKGKIVMNIVYIEQIQQVFISRSQNQQSLQQFISMFEDRHQIQQQQTSKISRINKYILIGASNTINLSQILLSILSKLGVSLQTKIFQPYSMDSLVKIMKQRILLIQNNLKIRIKVQDKLLKYIVNKLSQNKRDDTRNVIQILKQIVNYIDNLNNNNNNNNNKNNDKDTNIVQMQINLQTINKIQKIKNMLRNSKTQLIQKLTYKQHLILIILYKHMQQNDALYMKYTQIVEQYKRIYNSLGMIAYEQAKSAMQELQTYGCIQIKNSSSSGKGSSGSGSGKSKSKIQNMSRSTEKNTSKTTVILKVSLKDIECALMSNPILKHYFIKE